MYRSVSWDLSNPHGSFEWLLLLSEWLRPVLLPCLSYRRPSCEVSRFLPVPFSSPECRSSCSLLLQSLLHRWDNVYAYSLLPTRLLLFPAPHQVSFQYHGAKRLLRISDFLPLCSFHSLH